MEPGADLATARAISAETQIAALTASTEEDLRIRVEHILRSRVFDPQGIPWAAYEHKTGRGTLLEGRTDALYGRVVIEYEKPRSFGPRSSSKPFRHALDQVEQYITELAQDTAARRKYVGVVLDGLRIGFSHFRGGWEEEGPFEVNEVTTLRLLEILRGLQRSPLTATALNSDLGPQTPLSKLLVGELYRELVRIDSPRVSVLFDDWKRVFSQVCGYTSEKLVGLEQTYPVDAEEVDYERLLFCVHTYFALIMKLIAAEVAVSQGAGYLQSFLKRLEDARSRGRDDLHHLLEELEAGDVFANLGIRNFLEGDYFGWYLGSRNETLESAIGELARTLSKYEPTTGELAPAEAKDLLKSLYQFLIPQKVRHDLGEYYTPDWLAELTLQEVGYDGSINKRLLDPACGSGTFLVLALAWAQSWAGSHPHQDRETLELILRNVVGFDLNPLAVIAARTNYLIAIGPLLRNRESDIEIPVYLADSILVEQRGTLTGTDLVLRTRVGVFQLPASLARSGMLTSALAVIEDCIRSNATSQDARKRILKEFGSLDENEVDGLSALFAQLQRLHKEGRDDIWARILRNSFAPLITGRFDFVVGNPPWVNWESLPEEYRKVSRKLWDDYALTQATEGTGLGKVKRDLSMLFVCVASKRYLADDGRIGFLLPYTLTKTQGGAGFRRFLAESCKVTVFHDLVELAPFEGAVNRTCLIVLEKGRTSFPIDFQLWKGKTVRPELSLSSVQTATRHIPMVLAPINGQNHPESPWIGLRKGAIGLLGKLSGRSPWYRAYVGAYTGFNSIYWVKLLEARENVAIIQNLNEIGKRRAPSSTAQVESALLYPMIRGRGVEKWAWERFEYLLLPHNPVDGGVLDESRMKVDFPMTYHYFSGLKADLESRAIQRLWGKRKPFYSVYDVGKYTFSPYKVVWKLISGKLSGKGKMEACVISQVYDDRLKVNRTLVPDFKLMMIPFETEKEAHYVCGVLNSSPVKLVVYGYTIETGISTHVTQNVRVDRFDSKNELHRKVSGLSRNAHEAAAKGEKAKVRRIEREVDLAVADLFGLTPGEMKDIALTLRAIES